MPAALKASPKSVTVTILAKPKAIDLDKLDDVQKSHSGIFDATACGKRAVAMFAHVEGLKTERAVKAILTGLYLHQVKAALDHGEFDGWKTKHFPQGRSTIGRYMDLSAKFSRSSRLLLPEIIGANQLTLELEAQDSDGRAVLAKLAKFVGSKGLTELMQRHDVIKQGGARPKPKPEPAAEDDGTPEEAEAAARASGLDAVETASTALLADELWHDLTPANAALIDTKLKALSTQFHDRLLKLKHAHAA